MVKLIVIYIANKSLKSYANLSHPRNFKHLSPVSKASLGVV